MKKEEKFIKIGKASFNVENVKNMSEKEFIAQHKSIKGMPKNLTLSEIYKKISGKSVEK